MQVGLKHACGISGREQQLWDLDMDWDLDFDLDLVTICSPPHPTLSPPSLQRGCSFGSLI